MQTPQHSGNQPPQQAERFGGQTMRDVVMGQQQGLGAPTANTPAYVSSNIALEQAKAQKAQAEAATLQQAQQGLNPQPDPAALLSEAIGTLQSINSLEEQVDNGVAEQAPALEQAYQHMQQLLQIVDSTPGIDNQKFQQAMLQSTQQAAPDQSGLGHI